MTTMQLRHLTHFARSPKKWANRLDRRAGRQRELLGAATVAYDQWRDQCAAVRIAYHGWVGSPSAENAVAFRAYTAALDREERAANSYARLIGRAGHVERGEPMVLPAVSER